MAKVQKEKTKKEAEKLSKYITMNDVMQMTGLSWPTARKVVEDAGAVVRIGRRVLVLPDKLDQYLHSMAE
jgi:predicted DNA-binding transcriptional regulator AlpA